MPRENRSLLAFNRGIISPLGLARVDLDRVALSAEEMTNWLPRKLGSMMLRPGSGIVGNAVLLGKSRLFPFVFASDDVAQLEISDGALRVAIDDEVIARAGTGATITNGGFDTNIVGWTDESTGTAVADWRTGGYLGLIAASSGDTAAVEQQVTTALTNGANALRIVVALGPAIIRVGTTSGADDLLEETVLGTGEHSLEFTANGATYYVRIMARSTHSVLIDSIDIDPPGFMSIAAPWQEEDLPYLRLEQSGDVVYVTSRRTFPGLQPRKIERRGTGRSWSVVLYEPETGPFRRINTTGITIAASALEGDVTLTASESLFKSTNVGSLYRLESVGQTVSEDINAQNTFTDPIRVSGVGAARSFGIYLSALTGTGTTVTLQFSPAEPGTWADVTSYTTDQSTSYQDGLDNQIIYYRIGVKTGDFVAGPVTCTLIFTGGSNLGVVRITGFTNSTTVSAIVLETLGSTAATADWWEGQWSDRRGWPSSVVLHESRLTLGSRDALNASITDEYEDFDDEFEGDAGPISRTIGQGPIETIPWLLSLNRLIIGTTSSSANIAAIKLQPNNPLTGKSSSFDEPLTPTNFNLKTTDASGAFVDPTSTRIIELKWDPVKNDYVPEDLSAATPDLNEDATIVGIAVQHKPDMRIWAWRSDGTCAVCVRDPAENLICMIEVETDGEIEDVSVLPGTVEDRVYWVVKRTFGGVELRLREKLALESECRGGTLNKQADSFITGTNSPASATIGGLGFYEGADVIVWADGIDYSPGVGNGQTRYTVTGAAITLPATVTDYVVGLPYSARWKSAKLAFAAALGSALNVRGKINKLGLILANYHPRALQYGVNFDELGDMPLNEEHEDINPDEIQAEYDKDKLDFDSDWSTDPRLCLVATAPRPVTVLAATVDLTKSG